MSDYALPPLKWTPSPNFSERLGSRVDLIVIHDTEGGYAGAVGWFANHHSGVSAHVVLKEDGSEAIQMVSFGKKAWHACAFNSRSIGLEMAGFAKAGYGENEWNAAAAIVAYLLHAHQIPVRFAEHGVGAGFCSHYHLGAAGGGHSDPTTDPTVWASFVDRVEHAAKRGDFPLQWGR
jgi:N-acetyl-anhydromuramyl-L-alanine amidase AmpD